jgi:MFS family permease
MLVSDVGRGVVQAVVAALLLTDSAALWHLVVLVALYGCFEAGFRPAAGGLVLALVPPAELQQANAIVGLIGYALSGPLADAIGLHETMVAASALVVVRFGATLAAPDVRRLSQESIAS